MFDEYINAICGRERHTLCETIMGGFNVLFEDAEGTAASRTRKYIRSNLAKYPLDDIARDDRGKPILTQSGKEQSVLDYLERQVRDVFFHNDYANFKFEPGVARIAFSDLDFQGRNQDARGIEELKGILKILCAAHAGEYDYNLNGMSFNELHDRFSTESKQASEDDFTRIDSAEYTPNGSCRIVEIHSFDESRKYYKYTNPDSRWCLTHIKNMWDSYTGEGRNRVYFVLKSGFEDMEPARGEGCPLDEYGLSMLCIIVTNDLNDDYRPMLCSSTCRWNHENGGSDSVMNVEQISNVIGQSFYKAFPPFSREELHAKGLYTFNEKIEEYIRTHDTKIFDEVCEPRGGHACVWLNEKGNYIDADGNLLSKQWFDGADDFRDGHAWVELNGKYNFIDADGNLLSKQWFDNADPFKRGHACVELNDTHNLIDVDGNLLSKQWFDAAYDFSEGYAAVKLNGKWNYIDADGNLLSKQWLNFDSAGDFIEGHAGVEMNGKWNYIDTNCNLLSKQWFDATYRFTECHGRVRVKGKKNYINTDGNLISDQWFDEANDFREGYAVIHLNGKYNYIDTNGNLISNQWFDYAYSFYEGYATVMMNRKYNYIDTNGNLLSKQWLDRAYAFRSEGYAKVKLNGKYMLIDTNGNLSSY